MKKNKKSLIILFISLFIALSFPISAQAADNEFTATLSVTPTQVNVGSVVTSTITVTNKDNTYGADISVSYEGEHIKSFFLAPGQQSSFMHNVLISKATAISYTVNASHGPDISNTKQTNTVLISIIQPDTPTPTPTAAITNAPTPSPTPAPVVATATTTNTTITATPIATSEESITPEPSVEITPTIVNISDNNTGWGAFISQPAPPMQLLGGLYGTDIIGWLGINKDFSNIIDENTSNLSTSTLSHNKNIYTIRRWILIILTLILLISIASSIVSIINFAKKNHS